MDRQMRRVSCGCLAFLRELDHQDLYQGRWKSNPFDMTEMGYHPCGIIADIQSIYIPIPCVVRK